MTRIAVVAASERLREALAETLAENPAFEVVGVAASVAEVDETADFIVVARPGGPRARGPTSSDDSFSAAPSLTTREREILALLADGLGNKQIAAQLGISPNTVKTHLELLFDKLNVSTRAEAVATGVKRGLLLL